MLLSTVNFSSLAHSWKPVASIVVTLAGMTTSVKLEQVLKASLLIVVTVLGSSILFNAFAFWNAPSPITVIVAGCLKVIVSKPEAPLKAPLSRTVTFSGITKLFNLSSPLKASA